MPASSVPPTLPRSGPNLDTVGAMASFLCAIHCALLPLVVTLLPLIGLSFLAHQTTEWILVGASALLGITSLCLGYREHGRKRPLVILSIGLALLALGRIAEARHWGGWGVGVLVLGGFSLVAAHLINRRLCLHCRACQAHAHPAGGQP